MLSISSYSQDYVDDARANVAQQVSAYHDLAAAVRRQDGADAAQLGSALDAFEPLFFNNSLMTDGATLAADTTIKLNPATSILRLRVGDEIRPAEEDFRLLADAFFAEIEKKYPAAAAGC